MLTPLADRAGSTSGGILGLVNQGWKEINDKCLCSSHTLSRTTQFGINDLVLNTGLDLHILLTLGDPTSV